MNPCRPAAVTVSWVATAFLSTMACGAPRLEPVAKTPASLQVVPAQPHGRIANDRYQWPGLYFEATFRGRSLYFKTGPGDVILNAFVDGHLIGTLKKPASGTYRIDGLKRGSHTVRIEALTEAQAGPNEFHGFALRKSDKALPATQRDRQIEFIGDSHTVGYGNTSKSRDCTNDEVWATTDTTRSFGAKVASHYGADYQINAISGRGIVRNYNGGPGDPLPVAYPFALLDHAVLYEDATWQPQIIVIALGTNDFSTPLHDGEKWATRDALHADYQATYVKFIEALRARNPHAFIIVWATDMAEHEIEREAGKVVAQLQTKGEEHIFFMPVDSLVMDACHWHPSLADHEAIAAKLIHFIDDRRIGWNQVRARSNYPATSRARRSSAKRRPRLRAYQW
jgi:lysophospholipase L1-like esterase